MFEQRDYVVAIKISSGVAVKVWPSHKFNEANRARKGYKFYDVRCLTKEKAVSIATNYHWNPPQPHKWKRR